MRCSTGANSTVPAVYLGPQRRVPERWSAMYNSWPFRATILKHSWQCSAANLHIFLQCCHSEGPQYYSTPCSVELQYCRVTDSTYMYFVYSSKNTVKLLTVKCCYTIGLVQGILYNIWQCSATVLYCKIMTKVQFCRTRAVKILIVQCFKYCKTSDSAELELRTDNGALQSCRNSGSVKLRVPINCILSRVYLTVFSAERIGTRPAGSPSEKRLRAGPTRPGTR